jgi:hypothetical protein
MSKLARGLNEKAATGALIGIYRIPIISILYDQILSALTAARSE